MNPTVARVLNNHLVVPTNNPGQLRAVFPTIKEATIKGIPVCAVPFTLDAARVLNNLGISAPSPIRHDYDWPGMFTPLAHQVTTAEFFTLHPRAFCLNDMGSMKTISALWAADYMQRTKQVRKVLVVAPLSTLDPTWADEIFKNFPFKRFAILHGSRERRKQLLESDVDIYIINHDGVEVVADDLMAREDIDLIILDELAVYRNARTNRWKAMNALVNKCGYPRQVWGLTGAPTPNAPTDAFGQCKLVRPENYKGHFTHFKNEVMAQVSAFRWVPRNGSEAVVARMLKPSIRYALEDCVNLPETTYSERQAQLSAEQERHYKELMRQATTEIRGTAVTAVNAAVLVSKLIQAATGCLYGPDGEVIKLDFGPRTALLKEIVEGCERKVIVFVPLTGALNAVADELRKHWTVAIVDGSTSMTQRNQIFADFRRSKDPHILVANAAAMSHGLTLVEASTIIWYAPITSFDTYNQANARIVRPGQKHLTHIVHIYATAAERKIYATLKEKGRLQDVVLDLVRG
jgi:SNF2 family DNA or RNA helicase